MTSELSVRTAYKLGNIVFTVDDCSEEFQRDLQAMLPHASEQDCQEFSVRRLQLEGPESFRWLVNQLLRRHLSCLWFDAACAVSPQGKKVLFAGKSHTGKSTTSLALALGRGWKVLAEDITLIDPATDQVLNFATPFSLKEGTKERLEQALSVVPEPILHDEWFPMGRLSAGRNYQMPFDVALYFELGQGQPLSCEKLSVSEYLRKVLLCSNLLRISNGMEKFTTYLTDRCYFIYGGTLNERMDKIERLFD